MADINSSRGTRRRARKPSNRPDPLSPDDIYKESEGTSDASDRADIQSYDQLLARFSGALDIAETACVALEAAKQGSERAVSSTVGTLRRGLDELNQVYTDLELLLAKARESDDSNSNEVRHGREEA